MTLDLTVLVQTKNEAVGIADCLASLGDFAEVIVVDSNSTDGTQAIVQAAGHRVVNFEWDGKYPKKKQWQLADLTTRHDWILFLDADEVPSESFLQQLPHVLARAAREDIVAFDLELRYVFDGKVLKHGHRVEKRALVRKSRVHFPIVDDLSAPGMGELEGHYQPIAAGNVATITDAIIHDDKDPVRTWFDRHNRYSDWETYLRTNKQARRSVAAVRSRQGRAFDRLPGKPLAFFLYAYLYRRGYLDGIAGLNYAVALSFYYWQINLKVREQKRSRKAK